MKTDYDKRRDEIEWAVFITWLVFVISALVYCLDANAQEPGIEKAISHLIRKRPNHRLHNPDAMAKFIMDLDSTSEGMPKALILAIAYRESSLDTHRVGKMGEVGLMQVHGAAAKGCDLETQCGQLDCGIKWLASRKEKCGTWKRAITAYMVGTCKTASVEVNKKVDSRIRFWKRIRKEMETE